ncbi:nucleotidyltransferase family protein [Morganella morganii]|uniref:nucleotidyltransferase family protein n=1 Tax=Morganella morganii TaxID=582 RepID=UPI0038652439
MKINLKDILISPTATIYDALHVINNGPLHIAFVVTKENLLLGSITDGDIRRGLLNKLSLEDDVSTIMNKKPIVADSSTSNAQLNNLMIKNKITSIPLVENHKIIAVEFIDDNKKTTHENPIFIMAGGFGTRLKPLTDTCPKPMLKIGNKPILETVIRNFIKAGFVNFYISTHYMPEKIHEHFGDGSELGINITYIHETEPLGTGGALGLLPTKIMPNLPLIMINGDILTTVDILKLLDFHLQNSSDATMCVREYTFQIPYGVVKGENNHIVEIAEKPTYKHHVNAGIYVISPELIHSVEKNTYIDMPTLLENRLKNNKKILMFPIHEYWLDIGRIDDFNKAQHDILSLGLES